MGKRKRVANATPGRAPLARDRATGTAFSVTRHGGGIAVLTVQIPDSPLNLVKPRHAGELLDVVSEQIAGSGIRGLVIAPGRASSFCAGADLKELGRTRALQDGIDLARDVQRVLDRIAGLDVPVVAAVHGPCLGVGAALALAADERVGTRDDRTRFGFPEVRLGLIPLGAAQRLVGVVGLAPALDLLLSGRILSVFEARRLGLIDEIVAPSIVERVAIERALERTWQEPRRRRLTAAVRGQAEALLGRWLDRRVRRRLALRRARQAVEAHAYGNHAAPKRLLEVVQSGLDRGRDSWLEAERRAFGDLLVSPQAAHLTNLFLEASRVARDPGVDGDPKPQASVDAVGVVGVAPIGLAMAVEATLAGLAVHLHDPSSGALAGGLRAVCDQLKTRVGAGTLDPYDEQRALRRLTAATELQGCAALPFVLVAARDRLASPSAVLSEVQSHSPPGAVCAWASTTDRLEAIVSSSPHPARVVGWVQDESMGEPPLLEIATLRETTGQAITVALAVARRLGHTTLVVRSSPCFYSPRLLGAWHAEALRLMTEGVGAETIDAKLVDWGYRRGPIASAHALGPDRVLRVQRALAHAFGERHGVPFSVERALEQRAVARPRSRGPVVAGRDIVERCVMRMVNEAVLCFGEGVIRSARDANVGAVLGAGFPALRGGPLRYVDEVGIVEVTRRLQRLARAHGRRFTPAPLLVRMSRSGGTFHGQARVEPGSEPGEAIHRCSS